jgi:succinoglycan biosynthesis protein ExoW
VIQQQLPPDVEVHVIVVDDASPCRADDEVQELDFKEPFHLQIVRQENAGAGAARNRGLETVDPSATLIAFLDSDDIWPANHLARAIQAMDEGIDFYFTDNCRQGHHESHCRSVYVARTAAFIEASPQKSGFLDIPKEVMIGLTLREFPCQASTVVYKRVVGNGLRFDVGLTSSGEDVLFFTLLASFADRVCLDLDSMVECGAGVNIYFSNLSWDSERLLSIKVDVLLTHRRIAELVNLSSRNKQWNDTRLADCRKELAFHMLRNLFKKPLRVFREIKRLAWTAPGAATVLPVDIIGVLLGKVAIVDKSSTEERRS